MDVMRYVIALMLTAAVPAAIVFWLLVHPFVSFWRKIGKGKAYTAICTVLLGVIASMVALRGRLLVGDLGLNVALCCFGVLLLLLSGWLLFKLRQKLTVKTLLGVPELSQAPEQGSLIVDGIYRKMRHPRYTQMTLAILGYALIANYPAAYGAFVLWCLGIYAVTVLEEKELEDRFGEAYRAYQKQVPRFLPRIGK